MIRIVIAGWMLALCLAAGQARAESPLGPATEADFRAAYDAWYALALAGDVGAQRRVAELQEVGRGVAQDALGAYLWTQIADFDPSIDLTQKLDELAGRLTPEQVELAVRRAYEKSIAILAAKNAPPALPVPSPDLSSYTWMCDCTSADDQEGDGAFEVGIGSKFTF
jgi:hypothetical protein